MKKLIFLAVGAVMMTACSPKKPHYDISGTIQGADNVLLVLQKKVAGKIVNIDSATILKGKFKIKGGSVEFPELVALITKDRKAGRQFYLENSEITISGRIDSLYDARVTGSKTQAESDNLTNLLKPYNIKYSQDYMDRKNAENKGDKLKAAALEKEMNEIDIKMVEIQKNFLKKNTGSYVAPAILRLLHYDMEPDEIESYINAMDTNIVKTPIIKDLKERVAKLKVVSVGNKAPDFTMNDVNGKPVNLSSKIGSKVLLIDFWAAWCGPCREENPNVVKIYREFNKKGFDVFGVSLDMKRDDWIKAIADDKLTWTQVSDLQYWNNAAARLYAVNGIPSNVLLDDKGIIIARNLRGIDLYNKVKEILGKK